MSGLGTITGDPSAITHHTKQMHDVATAMAEAARKLRGLTHDVTYVSAALDKASGNAGDVAKDLDDSAQRYRHTADALDEYAAVLSQAQHDVANANAQAGGLDIGQAQANANRLGREYRTAAHDPGTSAADKDQLHQQWASAEAHLSAQQASLQHFAGIVQQAQSDVDAAAKRAVDKVEDAIKASKLNDNVFYKIGHDAHAAYEDVKKWYDKNVAPILNALADLAGDIADILSIVGVVLALIPGLQALAGLVELVSLGLNLFQFGVKLMDFAMGDLGWGELLSATIGIVITVVTSKVGGRFISNVVKGGKLGKGVRYAVKMQSRTQKGQLTHVIRMIRSGEQHDKEVARILKQGIQWKAGGVELGKDVDDYVRDYDTDQTGRMIDGKPTTMPDIPLSNVVQHVKALDAAIHHTPAPQAAAA